MMHHRDSQYVRTFDDDRRRPTACRRPGTDPLERTVRAAASSDGSAWTTLMDRFGARVRGVAWRHGLGAHDVDDVAQATWLHLFEHIDDLREPLAIGAWLETTARHESLRVLRSGSREQPTDGDIAGSQQVEPVDDGRLIASAREDALRASVQRLPERQSQLITMLLSEPAPEYAEISRTLGIPHGSIGPTRRRGMDRLRNDEALVALCAAD